MWPDLRQQQKVLPGGQGVGRRKKSWWVVNGTEKFVRMAPTPPGNASWEKFSLDFVSLISILSASRKKLLGGTMPAPLSPCLERTKGQSRAHPG